MGEIRKDYLLDRYVIIAENRFNRPQHINSNNSINSNNNSINSNKTDYFAPGNEDMTPDEIGRLSNDDGGWKMRWFPNKFPAVNIDQEIKDNNKIKTDNDFFTFSNNYGEHEILVETETDNQLWDLGKDNIRQVFEVYNERIENLSKVGWIKYVCVIKNHGLMGGASLEHSHSQIFSLNFIPTEIREKCEKINEFEAQFSDDNFVIRCPYCQIINVEGKGSRFCFENKDFIAFTPYASRFNYEIWVFPKEHKLKLKECNLDSLADVMCNILCKLKELNCSYNFFLYYSPEGEDMHFHIGVYPRISKYGGLEVGTGDVINIVSPETAAKFYRGELKINDGL